MPKLLKPGGPACHKHDDEDERFCSCKDSLKIESEYLKVLLKEGDFHIPFFRRGNAWSHCRIGMLDHVDRNGDDGAYWRYHLERSNSIAA